MMKKKSLVVCCLIFCIFVKSSIWVQANEWVELNSGDLYARSAVLMDGDNGRILYGKEEHTIMPMASTTKIMTCIVALEYGNLDDVYTVSSYAASMPKVKLGVVTGESYRLEDLLHSLMLESHNDVAVVIAEGIAGSVEGFAILMNQKAQELGCVDTNFVTPNGLDAQGHYTTAAELGKIAAYAIQNETFLKITQTREYTFSEVNGKRSCYVANKNAFLDLFYGCISGKTGYTGNAGYCYVGAVQREEKTFIGVVLACGWPPSKNYKWHDMKLLMNYGLEHYEKKTIFQTIHPFDTIQVEQGQIGSVEIGICGEVTLLMREQEEVSIQYQYDKSILAPVEAGQVIGIAYISVGEEVIEKLPIYTIQGDKKIDYPYCVRRILSLFFV